MSTATVNISTTNWMKAIPNKDGIDALYLGDVKDEPNLLAVVIKGGGTRFHCKKHERVFHPTAQCPDCAGNAIPEPATA